MGQCTNNSSGMDVRKVWSLGKQIGRAFNQLRKHERRLSTQVSFQAMKLVFLSI